MAKLSQPRRSTAAPFGAASFKATKGALSLFCAPAPVAAPSQSVVAAVLQFGDLREEHEDGRVTLRFSAARLMREDMTLLLGDERERARDVSVVWDEAEAEMVRVIDLAPLRAGRESVDQTNRYAAARKRSVRAAAFTPHAAAA